MAYRLPYALCLALVDERLSVKESAKLRRGRVERHRYYLQFTDEARRIVATHFAAIAEALQLPAAGRTLVTPWLATAADLSFGAAVEDGALTYRVYVAVAPTAELRRGQHPIGIGVGWMPGAETVRVKDYFLDAANDRVSTRRAIVDAIPTLDLLLLDLCLSVAGAGQGFTETFCVTDRGGRRRSFDMRVVAEEARIARLVREMGVIAVRLGAPHDEARQWIADAAFDSIDRISVGVDGNGEPTVTIYHGARWTEPRDHGRRVILFGIGEVEDNPWFDGSLPKVLVIGTLSVRPRSRHAELPPDGASLERSAEARQEAVIVLSRDGVVTHLVAPRPLQFGRFAALVGGPSCAVAGWIRRYEWLHGELIPVIEPAGNPVVLAAAEEPVAAFFLAACANRGESPRERAVNFAITRPGFLGALEQAASERRLAPATLSACRAPFCPPRRDCWDVTIELFSPTHRSAAVHAWTVTVDVSEPHPVLVGEVRQWVVNA